MGRKPHAPCILAELFFSTPKLAYGPLYSSSLRLRFAAQFLDRMKDDSAGVRKKVVLARRAAFKRSLQFEEIDRAFRPVGTARAYITGRHGTDYKVATVRGTTLLASFLGSPPLLT